MASNRDFSKADFTNLPKLELIMILAYMGDSNKHNAAEIRGAKALMSSRSSYLDTCIGYVEVRRSANICTVRAKVAPEHRIRNKPYSVSVSINEYIDEIVDAECDGCAAALGGCKHSLLILFWLAKRTDEPACTSVTFYWKKPKLFDTRVEPVESTNIYHNKGKNITLKPKDINVLKRFEDECKKRNISESLIMSFKNKDKTLDKFNVFDMTLEFIEKENDHSFGNYKTFIDNHVSQEAKQQIKLNTVDQADSKLWHNLRQARITASQIYDAAHCSVDGSLVQQILGGYKVPGTSAMKRGKTLESAVIKEIQRTLKIKIQKSGFILINGLVGASPDGIKPKFCGGNKVSKISQNIQ